jgi:hypothetical protein
MNADADTEAIYCLGNDTVYPWLVAACRSIRQHEGPDRSLRLIPFDDNIEKVMRLESEFGLEIVDDPRLADLDEIGRVLRPDSETAARALRKLIAFLGPAKHFLFIDADAIVLRPLDPFFDVVRSSTHDLYFLDADIAEVYREGPFRDRLLTQRGARGFNSGIFGGKNSSLTLGDIRSAAHRAKAFQHEFVSRYEQSFMNFLFDSSSLTVASFREESATANIGGSWAGLRLVERNGSLMIEDRRCPQHDYAYILHWAGYHLDPFMPYRGLYRKQFLGPHSRTAAARFESLAIARFLAEPRSVFRAVKSSAPRFRTRHQRRPRRAA